MELLRDREKRFRAGQVMKWILTLVLIALRYDQCRKVLRGKSTHVRDFGQPEVVMKNIFPGWTAGGCCVCLYNRDQFISRKWFSGGTCAVSSGGLAR